MYDQTIYRQSSLLILVSTVVSFDTIINTVLFLIVALIIILVVLWTIKKDPKRFKGLNGKCKKIIDF